MSRGEYFVWKYEATWNNAYKTSLILEKIIGRQLTLDEIGRVQSIVDPAMVRMVQNELPPARNPFDSYCRDTGIHKNHMGPDAGHPRLWKHRIPLELQEWVTAHYQSQLRSWGYQL
jgi:hypothetical protein